MGISLRTATLLAGSVFLLGYGVGKWGPLHTAASAGLPARRVLYYRCPMHPSYHSDKPGVSPCCNMALEPVYEGSVYEETSDHKDDLSRAIRITPQQQQLMGVEYGKVEYAPVSRSIRGVAQVRLDETRVARIQTKLEGFVDHLYVNAVGEKVTQGQPLFSIFHRRAYSMAQAAFLEASFAAAGMGSSSAAPNAEKKRISDGEAARAARQQLEMLGFSDDQIAAVSRAHQPLASLPVGSPISGVIVEYHMALNQKVSMEPLLTIADLSNLWVIADFSPSDSAAIHAGQAAMLTVPYFPGKEFHGVVQTVLPDVDTEARTIKVRVEVRNPELLLKPDMFGQIELKADGGRKRLTVPAEAVMDSGLERTVFADLGNGSVAPRTVKTGERFGDRIEILQGLQEGSQIVTSGSFLLDSESRIRSRN